MGTCFVVHIRNRSPKPERDSLEQTERAFASPALNAAVYLPYGQVSAHRPTVHRAFNDLYFPDVEINFDKHGYRYFSVEKRTLEECEDGDIPKWPHERGGLSEARYVARRRGKALWALYGELVREVNPRCIHAYDDGGHYVPARSYMTYYADMNAVLADVRLMAVENEELTDLRLHDAATFELTQLASKRVQALGAGDVERALAAPGVNVCPLGAGFGLVDPHFEPLGSDTRTFFKALLTAT